MGFNYLKLPAEVTEEFHPELPVVHVVESHLLEREEVMSQKQNPGT
jgi:hypothetical protein